MNSPKVGLVVAHLYDNMQLANHVLLLEDLVEKDRNPSKVYSVHKRAFTLSDKHKNEEVSTRKNLQRRAEKELFFGDIIEWHSNESYSQNSTIYSFKRSLKLFETRCENGKSQIKVEGCIDPNKRNRFWSPHFPCIHIRGNNNLALPNVYLEAWVSIEIHDDRVVQFDLVNIHSICPPEEQGNVGKAPWNVHSLKYNTITIVEFNDDDELFEDLPPKEDEILQEVYNVLAFAVNDRSFYAESKSKFRFALVVFEDLVVSGSYYKLDAIWNSFDEYYMVTKAVMKKDLKNFPIDESGRIRVSVKQNEEYPGAFYSESLGFIDDPYNTFALLNVSPYRTASFMVALEDGIPNRQFRFRVVDVIDSKERLKKFANSPKVEVKHVLGIAINSKEIFSPIYPQVAFKVPAGLMTPKLGVFLQFTAVMDPLKNFFEISTWKAEESRLPLCAEIIPGRGDTNRIAFKTLGRKIAKKDFKGFFSSEDFGLLDDRGKADSITDICCPVWVSYTESSPENGMRQSRTPFEIVAFGEELDYPQCSTERNVDRCPSENYNKPSYDERMYSDRRNDVTSIVSGSMRTSYFMPNMSVSESSEKTSGNQDSAVLNDRLLQHRKEKLGSSIYSRRSNYTDSKTSFHSSMTGSIDLDRESCFERYELLKHDFSHSPACSQLTCSPSCLYLGAIVEEINKNADFYRNLRCYFPLVAEDLKQRVRLWEKAKL